MHRYFFHLFNHLEVRDEEGKELVDLDAAKAYAIVNARGVMTNNVTDGEICLSHRIEIADDQDRPAAVIYFRDALSVLP